MAKTLFVKITLKEEKKSGKPKKNQKKIDILDNLLEKTLKKHMNPVRFRLFSVPSRLPGGGAVSSGKSSIPRHRGRCESEREYEEKLDFSRKKAYIIMDLLFYFGRINKYGADRCHRL